MLHAGIRVRFTSAVSSIMAIGALAFVPKTEASCGAVSCFVTIDSQQQVAQEGLLTINGIYNYTPMRVIPGTTGIIPGVDTPNRQLIIAHHEEVRTITQTATLDLNYGITERWGLEITIPYLWRTHNHIGGLGEDCSNGECTATALSTEGLGGKRVGLKYNVLPTLRSMVVVGFGVYLPTGVNNANDSTGVLMEPTTQLGRKQFGLNPTLYQTYELIPHRLNQFAFASYRHTFKNSNGYQFGDQWDLNGGFKLMTVPWLVVNNPFNFKDFVDDTFDIYLFLYADSPDAPDFPGEPIVIDPNVRNRRVPTTGSSFFAFTPGFQLSLDQLIDSPWARATSVYFYSSVPIARDSNNSLAQETSFVAGLTRSFRISNP